jgi:hypothetical protein
MHLKKQKLILIICFAFGVFFLNFVPTSVQAAGLVPCGGINENPCKVQDLFILVARCTNWLVATAGVYAFYKIVEHGFFLIVSLGREESITQHKSGITNAIVGFVMVLFAFMFVNTVINVILGPGLIALNGTTPNAKCKIDLSNPLNYLDPNYFNPSQCNNIAH